MKTTLTVRVDEAEGPSFGYCTQIEPRLMKIFEPVHVCDDSVLAPLVGAITSDAARIVTKQRKDYANYLAAEISEGIMTYIERNDTVNGYKKAAK